jgi:sulfonate transport system substrate-binding protein
MIERLRAWSIVLASSLLVLCAGCKKATPAPESTIRISVGTQDATINCATAGLIIRELHLLEKYLPTTGKYAGAHWEIVWKDFSTGAAITSEMVADKIDIASMGDFPSILNAVAFKKQGRRSVYLATVSESVTGGGNGLLVPLDSPARTLADLKGKQISVPFGSAAHAMLLRAVGDLGWDPEKDVNILAQAPEIGGSSLKANKVDAHADFVPFAELFPYRGFARKIYDGSTAGAPTSHGVLARGDYVDRYPEVIVAFLKASIEADRIFSSDPEKYSELIEKVIGVEADVDYMFHGPLGIQTRDFTIKPEVRRGLQIAIDTLKLLKKTDTPLSVDEFVDERFIRQAARELGVDYDARLRSYAPAPLTAPDHATGLLIDDPKLAAQVWIHGEDKVWAFATPESAFAAIAAQERAGRTLRVAYVHDRETGVKLLAKNAYYVSSGGKLSAFLLKDSADAWAKQRGGTVVSFSEARAAI